MVSTPDIFPLLYFLVYVEWRARCIINMDVSVGYAAVMDDERLIGLLFCYVHVITDEEKALLLQMFFFFFYFKH